MEAELASETYEIIKRLCSDGDELCRIEKYSEALKKFSDALELVPQPIEEYEASTWVLTAIGDTCFALQNFSESADELSKSLLCPNAVENPFIHLRLGQAFFELGETDKSANELTKAYMLAGSEIFESEDSKYFEFLKTKIRQPSTGSW